MKKVSIRISIELTEDNEKTAPHNLDIIVGKVNVESLNDIDKIHTEAVRKAPNFFNDILADVKDMGGTIHLNNQLLRTRCSGYGICLCDNDKKSYSELQTMRRRAKICAEKQKEREEMSLKNNSIS